MGKRVATPPRPPEFRRIKLNHEPKPMTKTYNRFAPLTSADADRDADEIEDKAPKAKLWYDKDDSIMWQ